MGSHRAHGRGGAGADLAGGAVDLAGSRAAFAVAAVAGLACVLVLEADVALVGDH